MDSVCVNRVWHLIEHRLSECGIGTSSISINWEIQVPRPFYKPVEPESWVKPRNLWFSMPFRWVWSMLTLEILRIYIFGGQLKILITHCLRVLLIRECILKAPGELLKLKTPDPSNCNKYPEMCHSLCVLMDSPVVLICNCTEEHGPRYWFSSLSCISHLELQKGEIKEEPKK